MSMGVTVTPLTEACLSAGSLGLFTHSEWKGRFQTHGPWLWCVVAASCGRPDRRVLARLLCYAGHVVTSLVQPPFFNSGCGAANESKEMTTLFEATRSSLGHISHSRYCGRQTAPSSHSKTGLKGALVIWQENNVQGELSWKAKCGRSAEQKHQCLMLVLLLPCRVLVNSYSL